MKHIQRWLRNIIGIILLLDSSSYPCSIVGYIGQNLCKEFIEQGLARLEYRGYDSAGFACLNEQKKLIVIKAEGKLEALKEKLKKNPNNGTIGIGHTRWATHGAPSEVNAHPHMDEHKNVAIVHNGIIENYFQLKRQLEQEGHVFVSETDSEIIPHLLQFNRERDETLQEAIIHTVKSLNGSFSFLGIMPSDPETLIVARKTAPLSIGVGDHEMFVASDFFAYLGKTNKVLFMPDKSFALVTKDVISLYSFDGTPLPLVFKKLDIAPEAYQKLGHEHYMIKEIYEQRKVIHAAVNYYKSLGSGVWKLLGITPEYARDLKSVHMFGCGTSWHAARIGQFFFEIITGIPSATHLGSEFRYMPFFTSPNSLYIAISQSGETADTLESLRMINLVGIPTVTLTNVPSSTMARESCGHLPLKAGPEIAVASTKAFTTQITALYWLAHFLALEKG
ncbi:MAG: glutamine--fructose-6-phosphate transaminase (isomerizing), partial [Candidatus Babeliales bacterium]|nr:glutamine--fructose-6-phosphate transaminase (isomerizing) [Candidatus Babeliales bacterium]